MAKNHGARQQKKAAKLKARRAEKRTELERRQSADPGIRLAPAASWPAVQAWVSRDLWSEGIGYLVIAREEAPGRLVYGLYLVDVFCLGVKDTFWKAGSDSDLRRLIQKLEQTQAMSPISTACLVKIVTGSVAYADKLGLPPHADYRHSKRLLDGIDPSTCDRDYQFGKDGEPFYVRGPNESLSQARLISDRIMAAGGHFVVPIVGPDLAELGQIEPEQDPLPADDR